MSVHGTVDLIRHGEPVGGRAIRGNGCDDPLSERGWAQMRAAMPELPPWRRIVTSPLLRCHAFAEEQAARFGLPLEVDVDLREVGFGDWEGHTHEELQATNPEAYRAFYADPVNCRPPGAEPLADFVARVGGAWERSVLPRDGEAVLVVTHAGVIRALLAYLLDLPLAGMYRVRIINATITRIGFKDGHAELQLLNGTPYR
ncbi:MAG TPA: histidine phosphatase family protein [Gammaproteobacteria bacterium]|nr:histidine phosphatase family protein [Gammaproteobacteria bacterium]